MRLSHPKSHGDSPTFTALPATKTRAFSARSYAEPSFRFLWHYHPEWELTWTSSGKGLRHVGSSVEPFEAGDLVLLAGNLPHTWVSAPGSTQEARCSVVHFLPQLWGNDFWMLPELHDLRALCDSAVRGVRFTGPGVAEVGRKIEQLAAKDAPNFQSFTRLIEVFAMLQELPVELLNATAAETTPRANPKLQQLLPWIEQRVTEPLSQSDVAAQVHMSPAAFSRWFKSQMGCVFQRYVNELRIARASALLLNDEVSITEAAFQSGFNNLSNFNRRFQDITGLTPKAFRQQYRERAPKKQPLR